MNKTDLINHLAEHDITKVQASRLLELFLDTVQQVLKKGEDVVLTGFGRFVVTDVPARKGRNPQTGKEILIQAKKRVSFRPGKDLKDAVNSYAHKANSTKKTTKK